MSALLYDGPDGVARTLLVGVAAYLVLVLVLRAFGKRTLSKMNAFDLVVTVALGSTLATVLLSRDVPLADGIVAFLVLAGMQRLITESSLRWHAVANLVKSDGAKPREGLTSPCHSLPRLSDETAECARPRAAVETP